MSEGARIDYLEGKVNGLLTLVSAVLRLPPDLDRFSQGWVYAAEVQLVGELAHDKSEHFAQGLEEMRERIAALIEAERERRARS